ncbi:MAG TPA: hypothetical protein DCO93_03365 [Clostridiales bacterium]|nr:hypothetical protein [Clostridiales bacterium]
MKNANNGKEKGLMPYLSPVAVWSLSLGTTIGWGSLVVTSNNYLLHAGPLGSVLGILIGAIVMLIISKNYFYLMQHYPDAGGAYTYAKEVFGYDQGFLTGWFLGLTYLSIFWANATSLPLFARFFFGDIFRFGYMYSIFGYDVYIGEMLLTIVAILAFSLLCIKFKKVIGYLMAGMAVILTLGISICFFGAILKCGGSGYSYEPLFVQEGSAVSQIIRIACISPWAFIGFESISHASEEFSFGENKIMKIFIRAVLTSTALYIFITILSVTAYPPEYATWFDYIKDLGNLEGIKALPAFYAAGHYMGKYGIAILVLSLLSLIFTSLFGNMLAISRLFYAQAKDDILPERFAELNNNNTPKNAIILVGTLSLIIPFFGRTAIGWIVDVTTIGATIIYGFVSASALKLAQNEHNKLIARTGIAGVVLMISVGLYLLIPELFVMGSIEKESYFLFTVWAIFGFIFFRYILKKDEKNRFGTSIVVWIALLSLILFTSLVWLSKSTLSITNDAMNSVIKHYTDFLAESGNARTTDGFFGDTMRKIRFASMKNITVVTGFFAVSISILLNNYTLMRSRIRENEKALEIAKNTANIDPLTGVKSRRAFADSARIMDEEIVAGLINEFSVVICDVNELKLINDTMGHKAGDEYIKSASNIICEHFAHSPVFRIGGDEFAVILTASDYLERNDIIDKLNKASENAVKDGGVVIACGMSDYVQNQDKSISSVIERADTLMYKRKKTLKEMGAKTR